MYDYVWLCMTLRDRERARAIYQLFHTFANIFKLSTFFKQFKLFHMIQMLSNFSYFSTNLDFVYLCSNDASLHKYCACFHSTPMGYHNLLLPPRRIMWSSLTYPNWHNVFRPFDLAMNQWKQRLPTLEIGLQVCKYLILEPSTARGGGNWSTFFNIFWGAY